jgi:hypothetical protein
VVPAAPRYDARILDALLALDDRAQPIAETCRRAATVAEGLGLPRPSYVHMRRIVHAQRLGEDELRARRAAIRRVLLDAGGDILVGRFVHPYEVADRIADITSGTRPR